MKALSIPVIEYSGDSRTCSGCAKCCEGWLRGDAYGYKFFPGVPCVYLENTCTIYNNRPKDPCQDYRCAWLDTNVLPRWMKPNLVDVIVNKYETNGIFFFTFTEAGSPMSTKVLNWMIHWAMSNRINVLYYINQIPYRLGTKEFMDLKIEGVE